MSAALMQRRIGVMFAVFVALLALALSRAIYLGLLQSAKLRHAAATQQVTVATVPAMRGLITDRSGAALAVSEPGDDIAATPYLIHDPGAVATRLAPMLALDPTALAATLAKRTNFVYVARQVKLEQAQAVARLRIAGKRVDGLTLIPTALRTYPAGWLGSQVIGTVGIDGQGLSGVEYSADHVLHGRPGQRRITSDAIGQPIAIRDVKPERPGRPIQLTLDSSIQTRTEDVLAQLGRSYHPKGATAIVMDPRSNAILAIANWPRVDANNVQGAPPAARQNRATGFNYEPGSTFKSFTVAGALEEGLVTPTTTFSLAPQIRVADRTVGEAESRGSVDYTTADILARSSNVGAITIGLRLGRAKFDSWVRRFGFGRPTGADLPGEEHGQVLALSRYSGSSMGNLPIGQGESVTPMQIATAYAAIANGGTLRSPHIVSAVDGRTPPLPAGHRIISERTAAQLRTMLRGVLAPGGTASEVSIPGYGLAGKTGTANKIDPSTGLYSSSAYVASFVGFAPATHPKLLVAVIADEPQGAIYGGVVAAPAFGQIMSFALQYLRIPPA